MTRPTRNNSFGVKTQNISGTFRLVLRSCLARPDSLGPISELELETSGNFLRRQRIGDVRYPFPRLNGLCDWVAGARDLYTCRDSADDSQV